MPWDYQTFAEAFLPQMHEVAWRVEPFGGGTAVWNTRVVVTAPPQGLEQSVTTLCSEF